MMLSGSMKSMKMDAKAREKYVETVAADRPEYPYGLSLSLDNDVLEKLGLSELPAAGKTVMLMAKATITSVSSHESEHGKDQSLSLQITELCLEPDVEKDGAAEKLYAKET